MKKEYKMALYYSIRLVCFGVIGFTLAEAGVPLNSINYWFILISAIVIQIVSIMYTKLENE